MALPALYSQISAKGENELDLSDEKNALPAPDSLPLLSDEFIFFPEDKTDFSPVFLMVEPLTPRFGFRDKNRDPFSIGNSETPALPGTKVPHPNYFTKKNKEGVVVAEVNQEFAFDREYSFSVSSQFRIFSWLAVGVGLGFGYEHLPFVCNLPDPQEEASLAPGESKDALPKYPTYYSIAVQNSAGAILGRLTSENFTDSHGNDFFAASLTYGTYRIELLPAVQFYPLQNAGEDLKGFFIEVAPLLGLAVDSPMKVYLDILYEANRIRSITTDPSQSLNLINIINQTIRQSDNWKIIQDRLSKTAENPFVHFLGGLRLSCGVQSVFENGFALNLSTGIGVDNSRGFYLQLKSSMGYCFR